MKNIQSLVFFCFLFVSAFSQTDAQWSLVNIIPFPTNGVGQPTGIGRVSHLSFNPLNPQTIIAASASGGLWKTSNSGITWSNLNTDFLPDMQSACTAIDPEDTNIIYLGTGDADYYSSGRGVWKSTDGGATWAISNSGMSNNLVRRLLIDPKDHNTIFAACNNGIYKSTDGGASWTLKNSGAYRDIRFKRNIGSSTLFAITSTAFLRSLDNGETWNNLTTSSGIIPIDYPTARIQSLEMALTDQDSQYVYLVSCDNSNRTFNGLFRSTDGGDRFTLMGYASDPPTAAQPNVLGYNNGNGASTGSQGGYNLCLNVHPGDKNTIYVGSQNVWRSNDGGASWHLFSCWGCGSAKGIHSDLHYLLFDRNVTPNGYALYIADDGGVHRTYTGRDSTFETISDALSATEFYKFGCSSVVKDLLMGGTQDNGLHFMKDKKTTTIGAGDYTDDFEFEALHGKYILPNNHHYRKVVDSLANNGLYNSGAIFDEASNVDKYYLPHDGNDDILWAFSDSILRCDNFQNPSPSALIWTEISSSISNPSVKNYFSASSPKLNANTLYVFREDDKLFRSEDALSSSPTFTQIAIPATGSGGRYACVVADPIDTNKVFLSVGRRVFSSSNKGNSWTEMPDSLPLVNIIKIIRDPYDANDAIYLANASGVYYRDNVLGYWKYYSVNLPTIAQITDLDAFNDGSVNSVIRVSTFGRGIWQAPFRRNLVHPPVADFSAGPNHQTIGGAQIPADNCNEAYIFSDQSMYGPYSLSWTISPSSGFVLLNGTTLSSPQLQVLFNTAGRYRVTLNITNVNGSDSKTQDIVYAPFANISCAPDYPDGHHGGNCIQWMHLNTLHSTSDCYWAPDQDIRPCDENTWLLRGSDYTLQMGFGDEATQYGAAWMDFNGNGSFENAEYIGGNTTALSGNSTLDINFTVPASAVLSSVKLRLRGGDNAALTNTMACGASASTRGETEDYTVLITDQNFASIGNTPAEEMYFLMYPVPAQDRLLIDFRKNASRSFEVYDLLGNKLSDVKSNEMHTELQTKNLSNGTYFIVIQSGEERRTAKFQIMR